MEFQNEGFGSDRKLSHPFVSFFHVFFRLSAIVVYLFGGLFSSSSFIGIFVTAVLLLSVDFWTVKNISGRIMVGLRWWNSINESGDSEWVFESRGADVQNQKLLNKGEVRIFWVSLFLAPAFWVLFFITASFRFSFQWLVLDVIGLTLSMSNLLGYLRCRFGGSDSVVGVANNFVRHQVMANMFNLIKTAPKTAAASQPNAPSNPSQLI